MRTPPPQYSALGNNPDSYRHAGLRKLVGIDMLGAEKLMKLLAESRNELQEAVAQLLVAVCHACQENIQAIRKQSIQARCSGPYEQFLVPAPTACIEGPLLCAHWCCNPTALEPRHAANQSTLNCSLVSADTRDIGACTTSQQGLPTCRL